METLDGGSKESSKAGMVLWQRVILFVFPMVTQGGVSAALGGLLPSTSGYSHVQYYISIVLMCIV